MALQNAINDTGVTKRQVKSALCEMRGKMKLLKLMTIASFVGWTLFAETGEIIQDNGILYLKDSDGKKSEILTGKKLAAQLTKIAETNFNNGRYDLARNYSQSSLESMVIGKEYDDQIIKKNLDMLLLVEKKLGDVHKVTSKYISDQVMSKLYVSLGGTYLKERDYARTDVSARKAIFYNTNNGQAHSLLGVALDLMGQYAEAVASYEAALRLNPKDSESHFNLACSYSLQKNEKKALISLEKALELGFSIKAALNDETLANIKETVGFKNLVKKYSR